MKTKNDKVIAIACGDLHLSQQAPLHRSSEPDWYLAMTRQLKQVRHLQHQHACPVICAGDIFDQWNVPPELINFALKHLPDDMLSIPGQHDLPYHGIEQVHKSGYGVLKQSRKIFDLTDSADPLSTRGDFAVCGFGWEVPIVPFEELDKYGYGSSFEGLRICVAHKYVWKKGYSYPNAPKEANIKSLKASLSSYDICIFGDNHKPWELEWMNGTKIYNCGGFMRRKADDTHKPSVGLIRESGRIERHYLDISADSYLDARDVVLGSSRSAAVEHYVNTLKEHAVEHDLDFRDALKALINDVVDAGVRDVLKEVLQNC